MGSPDTQPMSKDVGLRLRHVRELRGLTQVQLAKKSGVSQAAISELETGENRSPWGTNLVKLAQSLLVSPEWLANGKGQMEGHSSPLPPEAERVARDWLRLAPEVRKSVANMIREMIKTSEAERPHAPDERVAEAYGKPGKIKKP